VLAGSADVKLMIARAIAELEKCMLMKVESTIETELDLRDDVEEIVAVVMNMI
jgi:hypothetical protein